MFEKDDAAAYAVFHDAERHTCIRLSTSKKGVKFIAMNTVLSVEELSHKEFEMRYNTHLQDYPVKQAAEMYAKASWLGMSDEARRQLEFLTGAKFKDAVQSINFDNKESIMVTSKTDKKPATKTDKKPATKTAAVAGKKHATKAPATNMAETKSEVVKAGRRATDPVVKTKVEAPKVAKAGGKGAAAKKPSGPDTRKIKILVDENPKHGGAAERFALYKNGMTVEKFIEAGGKREDIAWDVKKKFISVE